MVYITPGPYSPGFSKGVHVRRLFNRVWAKSTTIDGLAPTDDKLTKFSVVRDSRSPSSRLNTHT